jgi:hypothetical protein
VPKVKPQEQEPGFYVVPKSTTLEELRSSLFTVQNPTVLSRFLSLNPYHGDIKVGSRIVLSDPNNLQCTREEALLMQAAAKTQETLEPLSPEEAELIFKPQNSHTGAHAG